VPVRSLAHVERQRGRAPSSAIRPRAAGSGSGRRMDRRSRCVPDPDEPGDPEHLAAGRRARRRCRNRARQGADRPLAISAASAVRARWCRGGPGYRQHGLLTSVSSSCRRRPRRNEPASRSPTRRSQSRRTSSRVGNEAEETPPRFKSRAIRFIEPMPVHRGPRGDVRRP